MDIYCIYRNPYTVKAIYEELHTNQDLQIFSVLYHYNDTFSLGFGQNMHPSLLFYFYEVKCLLINKNKVLT